MIIKGDKKYIKDLSKLWKEVFSETDEAINIFFEKQYGRCEAFCIEKDGCVVSAFYLLPCQIKYNGLSFYGRYLYAAATYPEYRGNKLMSCLINEAKQYCENNSLDFISLLPAEESLYGYYERFGFRECMYRYETTFSTPGVNKYYSAFSEIETADKLKKCRDMNNTDALIFDVPELDYIINTMKYYGSQFVSDENCYAVINKEDNEISEFIGSDIEKIMLFSSDINGEINVYSPYDLSIYGTSEKKKFGMVYSINGKLDHCRDIYMNLGLD